MLWRRVRTSVWNSRKVAVRKWNIWENSSVEKRIIISSIYLNDIINKAYLISIFVAYIIIYLKFKISSQETLVIANKKNSIEKNIFKIRERNEYFIYLFLQRQEYLIQIMKEGKTTNICIFCISKHKIVNWEWYDRKWCITRKKECLKSYLLCRKTN